MKKFIIIITFLFFIFCFKDLAVADYLGQQFGDMDASNDDRVTWAEYKDYVPYAKTDDFNEADMNRDGQIELYEWVSYQNSKDPQLNAYRYRYKNKYGQLYKYTDGQWYRREGNHWYYYRNGLWLKHRHVRHHWRWHDDCYWGRGWYDDYDRYHRFRFGFSYSHRH